MAGGLDAAQVRHVAELARLHLSDDEHRLLTDQLRQILDYFELLATVDTTGVEPLAHPLPLTDVVRADEPGPSYDADRALANAPERVEDFFRVPPVLDQTSA